MVYDPIYCDVKAETRSLRDLAISSKNPFFDHGALTALASRGDNVIAATVKSVCCVAP